MLKFSALAALTGLSSLPSLPAVGAEPSATDLAPFLGQISAGTIASISDGDFVAQTYATGRLAPSEAGHRDLLTVLSLAGNEVTMGTLPVSNSVTAAPEILALTRDARTAFVAERLGKRPDGAETAKELPPGRRLFAIDLTDETAPRLADAVEIAAFPEALSVSPDGERVAIICNTPQASLVQIVPFSQDGFDPVAGFDLADLGITGNAPGPRGGVTATNIHWHPSGRFIAVNLNTQNRLAFVEVTDRDGQPGLRRWGNVVEVGTDPFVGRFTPHLQLGPRFRRHYSGRTVT